MPVSVTIRESDVSAVQELTLDELKERIRTGGLGPSAQIKDRNWTGNEWQTLDNLRLFHSLSPQYHAPGAHLAKKLRHKSEKEAAQEAVRAWQKKVSESLPDDFFERCYGTRKLTNLRAQRSCLGISRLIEKPAFGCPRLITLTFGPGSTAVEILEAKQSPYRPLSTAFEAPWLPLPDWTKAADDFAGQFVDSWSYSIAQLKLPEAFRTWEAFMKIGRKAGDCCTPTLDGIGFVHEFEDVNLRVTAMWSNPDELEYPLQTALVAAYRSLVPGRLGRLFKGSNA